MSETKHTTISHKPTNDAPRKEIVAWIMAHWKNSQWGLTDCDRCPVRVAAHPCHSCGRWPDLIEHFKRYNHG